jgi:GAF domain-containing protein
VYSRNPMVLDGVIGAYAGVPLIDDGFVLGSVSIFDGSAREFSAEVLEILGFQARLAASVLALRRSARTDVLTGLPNREVLLDRLRMAIARLNRHTGLVCVLYFDLDDFKGINDELGHAAGGRRAHRVRLPAAPGAASDRHRVALRRRRVRGRLRRPEEPPGG